MEDHLEKSIKQVEYHEPDNKTDSIIPKNDGICHHDHKKEEEPGHGDPDEQMGKSPGFPLHAYLMDIGRQEGNTRKKRNEEVKHIRHQALIGNTGKHKRACKKQAGENEQFEIILSKAGHR